jgi:hypothetical protein
MVRSTQRTPTGPKGAQSTKPVTIPFTQKANSIYLPTAVDSNRRQSHRIKKMPAGTKSIDGATLIVSGFKYG